MNRTSWLNDVIDEIDEQGFRYERVTGGQGVKVFPKDQTLPPIVVRASTDQHGLQNSLAALRRIGVEVQRDQHIPKSKRDLPVTSKVSTLPTVATISATPNPNPPVSPKTFAEVRSRIEAAVDNLAEALDILNHLETNSAKLIQLRDLLRDAL